MPELLRQFKAALDAIETLLDAVEFEILIRLRDLNAPRMAFQEIYAQKQPLHIVSRFVHPDANMPEVLEHQILRLIDHGDRLFQPSDMVKNN